MSTATLYSWNDVENEQLNPLLSRKLVTGEKCMFARVVLAKGCVVPRHSHHNEQITFITEGALRFDFDDGSSHTVHAGEVLVIPGNVFHSATAEEDCVDFDIFSPPRQDWINKDDAYLR
jgi:quercetin dioxygenase-like cupin family protein